MTNLMTPARPRRRFAALVLALPLALAPLAACGDDSNESSEVPENVIVSDADVTKGLAQMTTYVDEVVQKVKDKAGSKAATASYDEAHEVWESVEGTVKKNSQELYLRFEDGLTALKNAANGTDVDKATKAAADVASATADYLKAHP
ncbi:MAG: hypothetical protein AB7L13_09770 [Acidimicrobiia bacterium]